MNHITRTIARSSTISSCFRIKHFTTNPFIISKQPTLRLSDLTTAFECINNIDEALALFHHMLEMNPPPSVHDYSTLFKTVHRMEHYTHVIHMFKKLTLLGREVNDYTITTVISCYGYLEQVELSFAMIVCLIKRGYYPDIVTFTCLIQGFFRKGKLHEGVGLFKNLIKGEVCEVDEVSMSTMLDGLCKTGNVVDAVELLHIAERNSWKLNVTCYTTVIDGLCKAGMLKDGMELLVRMVDKGVAPDVVCYTCFIHGLCMNGKLDFACVVFNDLASKGINPNVVTYTVMMQGLVRKGLFLDAKELLERMERVGCFPCAVTYNVIIQGCLHHLHSVESVNLLTQIVGKDFQLDAPSFFVVLRQIQVLRGMKDVSGDDVCNQLIEKLISSGAVHQLRDRYDEYVISSLINKLNCSDS